MNNIKIEKRGTIIGRAVDLDALYSSFFFKTIFVLLWLLELVSLLILANNYYFQYFILSDKLSGISFLILALFFFYLADRSYYLNKVKYPALYSLPFIKHEIEKKDHVNLYEVFSFELAKATKKLFEKNVSFSTIDLISCLLNSSDMDFILNRLGIGKETLSAYLANYPGEEASNQIFDKALSIALLESHHQIEVGDVFAAICSEDNFFKKLMQNLKLEMIDLLNVVYWQTQLIRKIIDERKFLNPNKLKMTGGIGRDWAFGWTPYLRQFSTDLTREIDTSGLGLDIIGHDKEIKEIVEALIRENGRNAIVVGEAGVGKKTTVLGFAKKVLEGETFSELDFQHVIKIDTDALLSGITHPGEITERVAGILSEVSNAGNIIIYIENFQNLLSSGDAGRVDATAALLPFLEQQNIHLLATCDIADYNKYIAQNSILSQRLTRVSVSEPNDKELIRILENSIPLIEYKTKTMVSYEAIKETMSAANKYIVNLPNPEKSINLLDAVATHAASIRGKTIVLPNDVFQYISEKFEIPAGEAGGEEKEKLLNLEKIMHQSVIGQEEAITAIANALRRARAGVTDSKKPIGSYLFLGPTGVGKTQTAKALAKAYFGKEDRMIRFDMSEFQNKEDVYRLIGGNLSGEDVQGALTTAVREHPFALILFDEIEKAHRDILDLFLQLLDEGIITDGFGRKISFSNTIVISTSNAGANLIRESIKNGTDYERIKKELLEYLQKENIYRPEFLNRFSGVIAFSPLSREEITRVCQLLIVRMEAALLKNKGVTVAVASDAIKFLAELGYDPQMGARPMERVISEKLENFLAKKILAGEINKGDKITISAKDIQ